MSDYAPSDNESYSASGGTPVNYGSRPESPASEASVRSEYRNDPEKYHPYRVIVNNLSTLHNNAETADVTLVVSDKRFPAHKVLLIASSTYFRNMFLGPWKESNENEVRLEDTEDCKAVFEIFLSYFYGSILQFSVDNVVPLLTLADKYDVKELKNICEEYMTGHLMEADLEHALQWLPFAEKFHLDGLESNCYYTICNNFEEASDSPFWNSITVDQLATILETDDIVAADEFMIYNIVQTKLLEETSKTKLSKNARKILPLIQFKMMAPQDLVKVEKSDLAKALPQTLLKNHLAEAYRYIALKSTESCCSSKEEANTSDDEEESRTTLRVYTKNLQISHFEEGRSETGIHIRCRDYREIHDQEWTFFSGRYNYGIELYRHTRRYRSLPRDLLDAKFTLEGTFVARDCRPRVIAVARYTMEDVFIPTRRGDVLVQFPTSKCWCSSLSERRAYRCSCRIEVHNILYAVTATRAH